MKQQIVLGDEAVACGALDAGVSCAYGYPGTPSTEIMEYLLDLKDSPLKACWSSNEKTAYEEALGVSFAGKRVLVTMKHVGINVAADPFMNSALLQIRGGFVLAVADDPGMHSSQNEQDSRRFADFAGIPCLEPVNQQEAYDMTREAFELSEKFGIPVMLRLVTRLSHSRAAIERIEKAEKAVSYGKAEDRTRWMLLPATARKNLVHRLEKEKQLGALSSEAVWNSYQDNGSSTLVLTSGLGRNYFRENLEGGAESFDHLHIGMYPLPEVLMKKAIDAKNRILVIEEGEPFIEKTLRTLLPTGAVQIQGKLDGFLPRTGELNPDNVRGILGLDPRPCAANPDSDLPGRPPQLCQGCPHADSYNFIKAATAELERPLVTSDIGCYALGALPPYSVPETIVCMGASVGMARGASDAGYTEAVAVIGDSTFMHSGMTALVDAVSAGSQVTVVILDNATVAMTGGQETIIPSSRLEPLIKGLGVSSEHIRTLVAHRKHHEENKAILLEEIAYPGVSVILSVRECVKTAVKKKKKEN